MKAANAVAALALATLASYYLFVSFDIVLHPAHYGSIGMSLQGDTVVGVVPGSSSATAGIKINDTVERSLSLHDRFVLDSDYLVRAGERATIVVSRAGSVHTKTVEALAANSLTAPERVTLFIATLGVLMFVAMGLVLVLLRPSAMTWAFYLVAFAFSGGFTAQALTMSPMWTLALHTIVANALGQAGVAAVLVFFARFPANRASHRLKPIERLGLYAMAPGAAALVSYELIKLNLGRNEALGQMLLGFDLLVVVLSLVALGTTYVASSGLERHRIKWVALGWACACVTVSLSLISYFESVSLPDWMSNLTASSFVVFPITVTYAILKHRVIDLRFVLTRSLTLGLSAAIVAVLIVLLDWAFSARLPTSRFELAAYAIVILSAGFLLNAIRDRIGYSIDIMLFPAWHRTKERAGLVRDSIGRAVSTADLFTILTIGVAEAFSAASAAVFERVDDGGFQRVAAYGWPAGTLWHMLPDDTRIEKVNKRRHAVELNEFARHVERLPGGAARPVYMIPICAGSKVVAVLLLGGHDTGAALDPDELRIIRRLCDDASLVYRLQRAPAVTAAVSVG